MSLRLQLLAFGSLTLVLPWAGMRFVEEMEAAQRAGLEASLLASAATVAAALEGEPELARPRYESSTPPIYARPLAGPMRVDGFRDDWAQSLPSGTLDGNEYWSGTHERYAYLFIAFEDEDLVYQASPGQQPYGDRVVLRSLGEGGAPRWLLLSTAAQGTVRAQRTAPGLFAPSGEFEDRVFGAWRETPAGFAIEIRAPIDLLGGGLGVAVIDVDESGSGYDVAMRSSFPLGEPPGAFIYQREALGAVLTRFARGGDRFRILDPDGWVLSETGAVVDAALFDTLPEPGLAARFFRYVLRRDDPAYDSLEGPLGYLQRADLRSALAGEPATAWFRRGPENSAVVAAAVSIGGPGGPVGAVLLEQASDAILTLADQALLRLMTFTVLASVVAGAGLLGFATLLSLRVRRLARAAETALGPKGEIDTRLPGMRARDEIGDLSRSFADLLRRLREHTQYLRTLTSKLSHELRTPLAIVSTSLDNLEQERDADAARPYLARIRDGASRLDSIVVAMSEATRIEHAIGESDKERFDLDELLEACCRAYSDVYPTRRIEYRAGAARARILGSKELVAQLLDKLVDNAVGFSAEGSTIEITLERSAEALCLAVSNRGPTLPGTMREQLFESLVSFRAAKDDAPHLGLGLYVVALIADFHGARAEADNLPTSDGVVFRIWFPSES